jgi:DNA-binding transcriptional LysR family regulator
MRYKGLDLNLLHALDVLLEVRNVSRAADRLGLSQSALSAALARLRDYFGDDLLMLEGRRMHATPFAEQLAGQLRICLGATDLLLATSRIFDPAVAERTFSIVASDYVATAVLAGLARRLNHQAPGIRLSFIAPDELAQQRLARGELDLMIAPQEYLSTTLPAEELYSEEFVVAGCRSNPALAGGVVSEQAVAAAGHIAVEIGSHRSSTFADRQLRTILPDRRIEGTVPSFTVVPWMLIGTQRMSMMHRRLARMVAQHLPIAFAPPPFAFPVMVEMVQFHRTSTNDAGIRWLIGEIRAQAVAEEPVPFTA